MIGLLLTLVVAISALLSGFVVLIGSRHSQRRSSVLFFIFTLLVAGTAGFIARRIWLGEVSTTLNIVVCFTINVALGISLVAFGWSILYKRTIVLSSAWLKVLTYIIIFMSTAAVYMLLFYIILVALFKIENTPDAVFVLNFIMIVILLIIAPIASEFFSSAMSIIKSDQVNMNRIIKRLNTFAKSDMDFDKLASFLARQLHFAYIGFVINGKIYGSKKLAIADSKLAWLAQRLGKPEFGGIWQDLQHASSDFNELGIYTVATLQDAHKKNLGQIMVGRPTNGLKLERHDLIQLEMIINLIAAIIETK